MVELHGYKPTFNTQKASETNYWTISLVWQLNKLQQATEN